MKIEQIYTGCLAHGAYYIESEGEVAIIDPLRETKPYLQKAERNHASIKYVLETHFHADFVSGHIDLAKESGATIVYGPTAKPGFTAHVATDGEILPLGKVQIKVLHTPGHTMESSCFLLIDENGKESAIFTGDTLFIGDVGRPDLAQKVIAELTQDKLARHLYHSLNTKILTLADDIIVYPGHGAGSACGKNMSKETTDTLGNQKKTNYALQPMSEDDFVKAILDGLTPPPQYFPMNVLMNIQGYDSFSFVLQRGTQELSVDAFEAAAEETEALILDTRDPQTFAKGFIPNSINIGIDGTFAPWVGTLVTDLQHPILLVADDDKVEEVVTRLARVGYDNAIGFLQGGFESWKLAGKEVDTIPTLSADALAVIADTIPETFILDARRKSEYDAEHIVNAVNIPLDYINDNMQSVPKDKPVYVHCAGGYRSMIFCSILKARGFDNLIDVQGGFKAIKETGKFQITDYVCPTTML